MRKLHNLIFAIKETAKVSKSFFLLLSLYAVLSSARTVIDLVLVKYLVEYAMSERFHFPTLLLWLLGYLLLTFLIKLYLDVLLKTLILKFEMKLTSYTYEKLYNKILRIDLTDYDKKEFYDKLHRAMEETELRYFLVCMQFFSLLDNAITCSGIFTMYHDPVIITAVALCTVGYLLYYFRFNKKQYDFNKREEPYDRFKEYLNRVFYEREYAEELRVSKGVQKKLLEKFRVETDGYLERYNKYLTYFMRDSIIMTTGNVLLLWAAGLYASAKFLRKTIAVGDFLVMLNIVSSMSDELIRFFKTIPDIDQSALHMGDIREILDAPESFLTKDGMDCKEFKTLEFRDVHFQYDKNSPFALVAVNFTLHPGEVIAVAGLNGSGKSTLMDILAGLIPPDQGVVMMNGIPYQQYNINSIRNLFGVVFQNFEVYEISVAENILMRAVTGKEDILLVEEALKYAGLYDKIKTLEKGVDTVIRAGEDGSNFSGGELQKIAIARAYASKAPILLFDEPTSRLDVYATQTFYEQMLNLKKFGKTVLFTTHKLYYVTRADRIFYVQDGRITEKGSHRELMELGGAYAALYKLQSHEFFPGGVG